MARSEREVCEEEGAATVTFQRLAELTVVDSQVTGHPCRVTGAHGSGWC